MTQLAKTHRRARTGLAFAALTLSLGLAGCGVDLREELGLDQGGPDEFQVVRNRPLVIPETLPQDVEDMALPQPGARSLVEPTPLEDAQRVLTGDVMISGDPLRGREQSTAETALLGAANADEANPDIRQQIQEDVDEARSNLRVLDRLFGDDVEEPEPLDAASETERLASEARANRNPDLEPLITDEAQAEAEEEVQGDLVDSGVDPTSEGF